MMGKTGLAHRADDHGSTSASATLLAGTTAGGVTTLAATGVIERPGDVDVFAFTAGAGAASFGFAPAARSANLDAQLDLHNGAGQLLASVNPLEALNATLSTTLPSAGTHTAVLAVTDNAGLTAQRSVTITAQAPVVVVPMRVADIALGLTRNKMQTRATAAIRLTDTDGNVVPGATVTGTWGGVVTGTTSVATASNGIATFTSPNTRAKTGTFTFTVTGVTLSGYSYDSTTNAETSDSLSF